MRRKTRDVFECEQPGRIAFGLVTRATVSDRIWPRL